MANHTSYTSRLWPRRCGSRCAIPTIETALSRASYSLTSLLIAVGSLLSSLATRCPKIRALYIKDRIDTSGEAGGFHGGCI